MATIRWPRGRMTKPLTTPYEVGDRVRLIRIADYDDAAIEVEIAAGGSMPRVGDVGTIRRVKIADPKDGDDTFLMIDVKWENRGTRFPVAESEITPAVDEAADAWLRRQLNGLNITKEA